VREVQREAIATLIETLAGTPLPKALARREAKRTLAPADMSALRDVCYQTLRHYGTVTAQVGHLVAKPITRRDLDLLLKVAITQLQFTQAAPHAIVHNAVELADELHLGFARGMVNGVLRSFQRQHSDLTSAAFLANAGQVAQLNFPKWWVREIKAALPQHWHAALQSQNSHPPLTLRVNRRRCTREAAMTALVEGGFTVTPVETDGLIITPPKPVHEIPGFAAGHVSVQDAGAQLAAEFLDCRSGQRVLDACAAPGGKTAHLLERFDIDLTALEKDCERIGRIGQTLARLGLAATVVRADAAQLASWWDGQPFDRILLDAPCSASGTARRNPDIRWGRRPEDTRTFVALQAQLLAALWQTLKPGGKLLYATCSVFCAENTQQAAQFARTTPDARPIPIDHPALYSGHVIPNATRDGFFYALFEKAL
jgi:16S rRNA (cytosine967-C5)-methyltransferase